MEGVASNPSRVQSFLVSQVHAEIDLSKKRKLLDEQLSLPIRKLKFRDADPGSEHSSQSAGDLHVDDAKSSQPESVKDSNSFSEELDCAMSQYADIEHEQEFSEASADDKHAKHFSEMVYACDIPPSTSSASCSSSSSKNTLFTLENGSFKSLPILEEKSGFSDDEHNEYEYHAHLIYSENEEYEEFLDAGAQEMINSSETPSDPFILSSGRWKIDHDSQVGTRKPTIDQEFEQYFSSLML